MKTKVAAAVQMNGDSLAVTTPSGLKSYAVKEMPDGLFTWQLDSRRAIFDSIARKNHPVDFQAHLPVVATYNEDLEFPVHTATKATGLFPKDEYLRDYILAATECLDEAKTRSWGETQEARIAVAKRLYENPDHIDRRKFGLVEIFQGQTYRNLIRNPVMAVQYTSSGPEYLSYQLNGVVEMAESGDPRFEFLHCMRMLFEYDSFHVQQPDYPSGYVFWICEVYEKSPRKRAGQKIS